MSGRSAYVRAKNSKDADKRAHKDRLAYGPSDDHFIYDYAGSPTPDSLSGPNFSSNSSYVSPHRNRRRQSISSGGSTYGYPAPIRKPRPFVVASAIEKSDFRTHLDGMSTTLRGKLGRLLRGGDNDDPPRKRRPNTASASSESDVRSNSYAPSISAVPSLSTSTSPSDVPSTYPPFHTSAPNAAKSKPPQESVVHKVRRFEGGGKLPQLGWKSLSNVRLTRCKRPIYICADTT